MADIAHSTVDDMCSVQYTLLNKQVYKDHRAVIVQTRFNSTGKVMASLDTDGVVR